MARQIEPDESFDDIYAELAYTEARLEDETDAAALAPRIEPLWGRVETVEKEARALLREEARVQASVDGANHGSDVASDDFAGALLIDVGRDREAARYRAFFRTTPSDFKRQPFAKQVPAMRGWLTEAKDTTLDAHRPSLETATARGERALTRDAGVAAKRGNLWTAREALAAFLTGERDALEDELAAIGRAKGHDRGWAKTFFRVRRVTPKSAPTPT